MGNEPLPRLLPALRDLGNWLRATQTPYLIIGGTALALLGRPRYTVDVDAVVLTDESAIDAFLRSADVHGFRSRIADPIAFARKARILLLTHTPSSINIDVSLAGLPFEEDAIRHGISVTAMGVELRIPRVEDLVVMKAVAGREQDFADIDTLLALNPDTDNPFILRWVRDFCEVLDAPETLERVKRLLQSRRPPKAS